MFIKKKGALELSIGTIVIIVIGMSMLILGLVLVRTIFTGSIYNVEQINDKVKGEINELFQDEGKSYVHLPGNKADVKQGDDWGVAFAFVNTERGTSESSSFTYVVKAAELSGECTGLTSARAESWIRSRKTGSVNLPPGETSYNIVRFAIPEDAPLCIVPFDIEILKNGEVFTTDFFDLVVQN